MSVTAITIRCSNCDMPIGGVLINDADAPVSQDIRVKCPFCHDYSWTMHVKGVFSFGGVAQPNPNDTREKVPDDMRDELPLTSHIDTVYEDDGTITFVMAKENYNADPAKCRA